MHLEELSARILALFRPAQIPISPTPPTPPVGVAYLYAQDAAGVARLRVKHSSGSDFAVFRDSVTRCRNTSGVTINKGEAVYVTGANGNFPTVAKAKADSATTMPGLGIATETAVDNGFITIQFSGVVTGLDTSAFAASDPLFISATTAGALTATEPQHPNLSQSVGVVITSNAGNGQIHIHVAPGHEGDNFGTNRAAWKVGPGSGAGAADLQFVTATTNTYYGKPTTVGALPAGVAGDRAFVTDANATTFASVVAGGGANKVPVYSDGANWRIG